MLPYQFLVNIIILLQTKISIYMRNTTVTSREKTFFNNWNATWYIWEGENMDIVASSVVSTYDINKTQNGILEIPWFHTPASHFLRNGHDNTGKIVEWKMGTMNLFCIFGGIFLPIPRLTYRPKKLSRKIPIKATVTCGRPHADRKSVV